MNDRPQQASRFTLGNVTNRIATKTDRILVYADPGWGKDSLAARMPSPVFLNTPGEDRLPKLIEQGLVPEVFFFPEVCERWDDLQNAIRELLTQPHDYRTFVLNTGNGLERLGQEKVCAEEYSGEWGEHGFNRFRAGEKVTAERLWVPLLASLDRLREKRRMRIVILCHKGIVTVQNPEGGNYDKIGPALTKHTWGYTAKWCDMILYGALDLQIAKDEPKSKIARNKAKGGRVRLLHCQPTAAYEAKNVHRLPPTIRLGDDPDRAYAAFRAAFPKNKTREDSHAQQTAHRKDDVAPEESQSKDHPLVAAATQTHGPGEMGQDPGPQSAAEESGLVDWMQDNEEV